MPSTCRHRAQSHQPSLLVSGGQEAAAKAWSSVAAVAPSVPTGHQPQTRAGIVARPSVSAWDPSGRVQRQRSPAAAAQGDRSRDVRNAGHRRGHGLHSVVLWGSCTFLRILLGDHVTATAGARRGGVPARGHALGTCTAGDSRPRNGNWAGRGGCVPRRDPRVQQPRPSSSTAPSQEASSRSGSSGRTAARSEQLEPPARPIPAQEGVRTDQSLLGTRGWHRPSQCASRAPAAVQCGRRDGVRLLWGHVRVPGRAMTTE